MKTRQTNGRFAKGNPGGPGRPSRTTEAEYLQALSGVVTVDRWRRIVAKAATDAEGGDARAREWLSRYLLANAEGIDDTDEPRVAIVLPDNGRGVAR